MPQLWWSSQVSLPQMWRHHENDKGRGVKRALLSGKVYNYGDQVVSEAEPTIDQLRFHRNKFTTRDRPGDPRRILIIPSFGEFGCEIVSTMYCIPRLVQKFPGYYVIAMGWEGRNFLYSHLVDEFWELDSEHQWLREYCRAFHHDSRNLNKFEKSLIGKEGLVVTPNYMARVALGNQCLDCGSYWNSTKREKTCQACNSVNLRRALFHDMPDCWKSASLPVISSEKREWARTEISENAVGICARNRKCYGRNLPKEFYIKLIFQLRELGYQPVWFGEPSTTLPCPDPTVKDFSRHPKQRDLESILALIGEMRFTCQFWTASTRLAAIVGTPYLLFESPDQLYGGGQEGYRLELITRGNPRKVIANHYLNVLNNQEDGIDVLVRGIANLEAGDHSDEIGLVDSREECHRMMKSFHQKVRHGNHL